MMREWMRIRIDEKKNTQSWLSKIEKESILVYCDWYGIDHEDVESIPNTLNNEWNWF